MLSLLSFILSIVFSLFYFHHKPSYSHLWVFGYRCYPRIRPYNTHKVSFHSTPSIFLGCPKSQKGFKCFALNGRIYIPSHVSFDESCFPSLSWTISSPLSIPTFFNPLSHIPLLVSNSNPPLSPPWPFFPSTSNNPSIYHFMPQPLSHNTHL